MDRTSHFTWCFNRAHRDCFATKGRRRVSPTAPSQPRQFTDARLNLAPLPLLRPQNCADVVGITNYLNFGFRMVSDLAGRQGSQMQLAAQWQVGGKGGMGREGVWRACKTTITPFAFT